MTLWERLYRAQHDGPGSPPRARPIGATPTVEPPDGAHVERVELSPEVQQSIERVLDRELTTFRANRAAALARSRLLRLTSDPAPRSTEPGAALPFRSARTPGTTASGVADAHPTTALVCEICGGPVRVDHLDLDAGSATFECLDCGRHWTETEPVRARPGPGPSPTPDRETSR